MLPLGAVRQPAGWTAFTVDEQYTHMTLWSICQSPLMFGGHLPRNDSFTLKLIANPEVLGVNQHATRSRQLFRKEEKLVESEFSRPIRNHGAGLYRIDPARRQ